MTTGLPCSLSGRFRTAAWRAMAMRFHLQDAQPRNTDSQSPLNANIVYDMFSTSSRSAPPITPRSGGSDPHATALKPAGNRAKSRDAFLHEPIWL